MNDIEVTLAESLQILALLGVVLALTATFVGVLTILRSTWRVTFGRGTLVLPFGDSENGPGISEILAEQLDAVEHEWQRLSLEVKKEEGLVRSRANLIDLGPRARALRSCAICSMTARISTSLLSRWTARRSSRSPTPGSASPGDDLQPVLPLSRERRQAQRPRSLHRFGATARLSALFVIASSRGASAARSTPASARRSSDEEQAIIIVRDAEDGGILDLIDDLAFLITKARLEFTSEAERWSAYRASCRAMPNTCASCGPGRSSYRDRAMERYGIAIEAQPGYLLARYNLETCCTTGTRRRTTPGPSNNSALLLSRPMRSSGHSPSPGSPSPMPRMSQGSASGRTHGSGWPRRRAVKPSRSHPPSKRPASLGRSRTRSPGTSTRDRRVCPHSRPARQLTDRTADEVLRPEQPRIPHMTEKGDLEAAERFFNDALERFQNKMAHANLGEIHKRRGEFDLALEEYGKARELDGDMSTRSTRPGWSTWPWPRIRGRVVATTSPPSSPRLSGGTSERWTSCPRHRSTSARSWSRSSRNHGPPTDSCATPTTVSSIAPRRGGSPGRGPTAGSAPRSRAAGAWPTTGRGPLRAAPRAGGAGRSTDRARP